MQRIILFGIVALMLVLCCRSTTTQSVPSKDCVNCEMTAIGLETALDFNHNITYAKAAAFTSASCSIECNDCKPRCDQILDSVGPQLFNIIQGGTADPNKVAQSSNKYVLYHN